MNDLFVPDTQAAQFRPDNEKTEHSSGSTVKQRRDDLSGVLRELAPDVVVVVEGPSRPEELQLFFDNVGVGKWATNLQVTKGQTQNIGVAVRTDTGNFKQKPLESWDTQKDKRFDPFLLDTDGDDIKEQHHFERRPLYTEINPSQGSAFRILGLHLKSKGIFDALEWSKWWDMSDGNRKKIIAEAAHVHDLFVDPYLTEKETQKIPLIVCGDINDGPGMDARERRLSASGIERLIGNIWQPELCLGNALFDSLKQKDKDDLNLSSIYTTSYKDPIFNNVYQKDWIDHILYTKPSPDPWVVKGKVNELMPDKTPIWKKYKHASDHYPVSVELVLA